MLKYNLINETDKEIIYEYFPEGGKLHGVVSFNKATQECSTVRTADNDKHLRYALKMFKRIRVFARDNNFEKTGYIAWG